MLHRQELTRVGQLGGPIDIRASSSQNLLGQRPPPTGYRLDLGNSLPMTNNREPLPIVLDGIEQIGELASSVGCGHIRHKIILSDTDNPRHSLATLFSVPAGRERWCR